MTLKLDLFSLLGIALSTWLEFDRWSYIMVL